MSLQLHKTLLRRPKRTFLRISTVFIFIFLVKIIIFQGQPGNLFGSDVSSVRSSMHTHLKPFAMRIDQVLDDALDIALRHQQSGHLVSDSVYANNDEGHRTAPDNVRTSLCELLRRKALYLVGPESTYHLHDYLLDILRPVPTSSPGTCSGSSACFFHPLCSPATDGTNISSSAPHSSRSLRPENIGSTNSSLLRYIPSHTLYPSPSPSDLHFRVPVVDPRTGVRITDSRWVGPVSKAGVVVMSRAPLPAPAWSHTAPAANLTWLDDLHLAEERNSELLSHLFAPLLALTLPESSSQSSSDSEKVAHAALHTTLSVFLPSVLSLLYDLHAHVDFPAIIGRKPVIWHGSWYLPSTCHTSSAPATAPEAQSTHELLTLMDSACDPWSLYYNIQVYLHDRILRKLLPPNGIAYLPLSSSVPSKGIDPCPTSLTSLSPKRDCLRYRFDTPRGAALTDAFARGLISALQLHKRSTHWKA